MIKPIVSAQEAVGLIPDGATVAIEGSGGGILEPDLLLTALRENFLRTNTPRDLCLVHSTGMGDRNDRGMSLLAVNGLIRRVIGGHFGQSPAIAKMAEDNNIEAYNLPIGVICHLYRDIASGGPGVITRIGMGTFVDPRLGGGKLNEKTKEDLIEIINLNGREYLFYHSFPINIALIRASIADEEGYLSIQNEPAKLSVLAIAQAVKNSGGVVIAQVKKITRAGSIDPRNVVVPGSLVDYLVLHNKQWQTYESEYNPSFCGEIKTAQIKNVNSSINIRKLIARRASLELMPNTLVNLGVGISDMVSTIAAEEDISDQFTLTVEQGAYGGVPLTGVLFGAAINPKAIIDSPSQFDFYDGGGIDIAFLGMAQADQEGNVNVSKYNGRIMGTGGFIDISQGSKKIIFCSTFTTKGLEIGTSDGKLQIRKEGSYKKFLKQVEQITYPGFYASENKQKVLYVTERAVFELIDNTMNLIEVADGINMNRDILDQMEFLPKISPNLKTMDNRIFREESMGLTLT